MYLTKRPFRRPLYAFQARTSAARQP